MPEPIFLCGPTGSGKSHLATALAAALDGEIVNADAFQLFHGAPVLTASPGPEDLNRAPHHLYGILGPEEACDAMRYRQLALPVIAEIQGRGRIPIVVGGSGLYLKFLSHGPSPLPPGDPAMRAWLDALPLPSLVARLQSLDPVEAARTDLANRRYLTRALEICLLTGQPCSELRDRWAERHHELDSKLTGLLIHRPRPDLHARIGHRTRAMLENGAIEEVAALPPMPPGSLPSGLAKAIGVPQIRDFLTHRIDLDTCRERLAAATRQYAKRQETWFRRERWLHRIPWDSNPTPPVGIALQNLALRRA